MAEDEDAKLAQQADEMAAVAERLNSANIAGVRAAVGDDHGKSPTVDISLVEGEWRGPTGPELLLQLRDEPRPGHPREHSTPSPPAPFTCCPGHRSPRWVTEVHAVLAQACTWAATSARATRR